MSHKNANRTEEDVKGLSIGPDNDIADINEDEGEMNFIEESEETSVNGLEVKVEKLKNDVKNLKKIKKQHEKLGKLEEKKTEILREIERKQEQEREKRSKDRHDKRKRK